MLILSVLTILLFHMLLQLVQIRVTGRPSPIRIGLSEFDMTKHTSPFGNITTHDRVETFGLSLATSSPAGHPRPASETITGITPAPFLTSGQKQATPLGRGVSTNATNAEALSSSSAATLPLTATPNGNSNGNKSGDGNHAAAVDLESELKAWMQRESSNWAEPANTPPPTSAAAAAPSPQSATDTNSNSNSNSNSKSTSLDEVFASQQVDMKAIGEGKPSAHHTTAPNSKATGHASAVTAFDQSDGCFASF